MSPHPLWTSCLLATLVGCADTPAEPTEPDTATVEAVRARGILYQRLDAAGNPEIAIAFPGGRVASVREVAGSLMPGSGPGPGQMAVSPDGKRLAFVSFEGGEWRLIARPLRGTAADEVILARDAAFAVKAAWSPDGAELAYVVEHGGVASVLLVPATGGTPRVIASASSNAASACFAPAWSPDGKEIAFSTLTKLSAYRVRDGRITDVFDAGGFTFVCDPQWSPDGKTLAFVDFNGIQTVPRAGGAPRVVTASGANARWSPDGAQLSYLAGSVVHVIRTNGHDDRVLGDTSSPFHVDPPQFLGDGKTVLFEQLAGDEMRLVTVSARGGEPVDLGVDGGVVGMTYAVPLPAGAASYDEGAVGSVTWPPGPGVTGQPGR